MGSFDLEHRTRIRAINRSSRRKEALTVFPRSRMSLLTSAATRFMGSLHTDGLMRSGTMSRFSFVAPVFQPAGRADWKVGVTATRFMGSAPSRPRIE
jgi:hypothetical protein